MLRPSVSIAALPRMARAMRRPQHPFQLRTRPWTLNPFMIAPVLPGETMKSLTMQSRVVTQPVTNPLIGWWTEYYWFYVKHRDLADREEFTQMVLNPAWSDDNVDATAAVVNHYFHGAGIDWVDHCLKRVCNGDGSDAGHVAYFREPGEAWNVATIDGLPLASITGRTVWDSLISDTALGTREDIGIVEQADVDPVTGGAQPGVFAGDVADALRQYQLMVEGGLTDMSYEDFLGTYGVRPKPAEQHVPELVRFVRKWTYPTNTIDPADGSPSSAAVWSFSERADKDRFFREPGFLFGVTCTRPKVYLSAQLGSVTAMMNTVYAWLPAVLADDPRTSYIQAPDGVPPSGPLGNVTDAGGYWFDLKDLFLYGEQFVNFTMAGDANAVAMPTVDLEKRYVTEAMTDAFFVSGDSASCVRQDGIVALAIAGRQADTSPTT